MRGSRGFTLMEMMIVITVISVLATIVGLAVKDAGPRAKNATETAHLRTLQQAVDLYNNHVGRYPDNLYELTQETGPENYEGPYIRMIPPHPWEGTYVLDTTTGDVTSERP